MWGESWEIKDKIGEKKISGGQKFWGGTFGGNAKKRGKTFLGGVLGSCEPQQILGGEFLEKCQKKKFRGEILGGSYEGACDAVGMVHNEKMVENFPKKI